MSVRGCRYAEDDLLKFQEIYRRGSSCCGTQFHQCTYFPFIFLVCQEHMDIGHGKKNQWNVLLTNSEPSRGERESDGREQVCLPMNKSCPAIQAGLRRCGSRSSRCWTVHAVKLCCGWLYGSWACQPVRCDIKQKMPHGWFTSLSCTFIAQS